MEIVEKRKANKPVGMVGKEQADSDVELVEIVKVVKKEKKRQENKDMKKTKMVERVGNEGIVEVLEKATKHIETPEESLYNMDREYLLILPTGPPLSSFQYDLHIKFPSSVYNILQKAPSSS